MGAVLQLEQLRNLPQIESQALSGLHELHPVHVRRSVAANAADGPIRLRQQALALIEPDGSTLTPAALAMAPMVRVSAIMMALDSVFDYGSKVSASRKSREEIVVPEPSSGRGALAAGLPPSSPDLLPSARWC